MLYKFGNFLKASSQGSQSILVFGQHQTDNALLLTVNKIQVKYRQDMTMTKPEGVDL